MKNIIRIFVLCCLTFTTLYSQQQQTIQQVSYKGKSEWVDFETADQISANQLAKNKAKLNLKENDELRLIKAKNDNLGFTHYRYLQVYKGVPIEDAIFLIHEKNGKAIKANGKLIRNLNINVSPTIDEHTALEIALQSVNASKYAWQDISHEIMLKETLNDPTATFYPTAELVIIDPTYEQRAVNFRLAYKFNIYVIEPLTNQEIYIDAHTGEILSTQELIRSCNDIPASGHTNYYNTVDFTVCYEDGSYVLQNNLGGGLQVFDANNTSQREETLFTDTDSIFTEDSTKTAVEVLWAMENTYRYFDSIHDVSCLDADCLPISSWVHYEQNLNNAYYVRGLRTLLFGDGDGVTRTSYTSIDIVGHEMTHFLIENTAALRYRGESGALNESFADIFGEMIERYALTLNDWIVGADIFIISDILGLRNLGNPQDPAMASQQPHTYQGNLWFDISPDCDDENDNCGVHTNSGVHNFWFHTLAEGGSGQNDSGLSYNVSGVGIDTAAAIAFRNLTVYLTPNSGYADARTGAIQAAIDLYGINDPIVTQTAEAWNAVGVFSDRIVDSLALVALYNSTNGANWTNPWNLSQPMDTWYGVTVRNGRVVCLDLDGVHDCNGTHSSGSLGNGLVGTLPPALGALSELVIFSMGYNDGLTGTIPYELGNLTNAYLFYLNNCLLTGNIPYQLGNLIAVKYLALSGNQLSGEIPTSFENLTNLEYLYLNGNQLTGRVPYWACDLGLTRLFLKNNPLTCYTTDVLKCCGMSPENIDISTGTDIGASLIDFCNDTIGLCDNDTYVFPGDCDHDGIVGTYDYLVLNTLINHSGPLRLNASIDPVLQGATSWNGYNGINPVHADSDGNGNVDNQDSIAIDQNFALRVEAIPVSFPDSITSLFYELRLNSTVSDTIDGNAYDLFLKSPNGSILVHGFDGIVAFSYPVGEVTIDITNSPLEPSSSFSKVINDTLHFAISRSDGVNRLIGGDEPVAIIAVPDLQGGDNEYLNLGAVVGGGNILQIVDEQLQNVAGGNLKNGNSQVTPQITKIPVNHTDFQQNGSVEGGDTTSFPPLAMNVTAYDGYCDIQGRAIVTVLDGTPPYTYIWSTGDTLITAEASVQFANFEVGTHNVTVEDSTGRESSITINIEPLLLYNSTGNQIDCEGNIIYTAMELCVLLEGGVYDITTLQMSTQLSERGLLPGQTPQSTLVEPTPAGQPYNRAPWNYNGPEGIDWTDNDYSQNMVDWILVSFRTDISPETEIAKTAAIVLEDGCVHFPNRNILPISPTEAVYIVIEHRNHMGIMTPYPISIAEGTLIYDFRSSDSYRDPTATGVGQKEIDSGIWVMYAGDCSQEGDTPSYDITGMDKSFWSDSNGSFDIYIPSDMNLDGDVNGADKALWFENNGNSSRVPR